MASVGVVRKIDNLGRVVLPKEFRKSLGLKEGTEAEMFLDGHAITVQKYRIGCIFCGSVKELTRFREAKICKICISSMANMTVAGKKR